MNVELVYVILKAICDSVEKGSDLEAYRNGFIDDESTLHRAFEKIKIADFQSWENFRQEQFTIDENYAFETNIPEFMPVKPELTIDRHVDVYSWLNGKFRKLRGQGGITGDAILESLTPEKNRNNVFKAGEASGASGSFFFFSHDKRFVIKTMTKEEMAFFRNRFQEGYFKHFEQNPNSLISRIYGIYTVKMRGQAPVHLMMLAHTLRIESTDKIERIFDLKGSTVKREVKLRKKTKRTKTLKDINFVKLKKQKEGVYLDENDEFFMLK